MTATPRWVGLLVAVVGAATLCVAPLLVLVGTSPRRLVLPVATPPNAIAYDAGEVTRAQMLRAGVALDAAAVAVVTLLSAVAIGTIWPALL